jgi:hypothetical protein
LKHDSTWQAEEVAVKGMHFNKLRNKRGSSVRRTVRPRGEGMVGGREGGRMGGRIVRGREG